MKKIPLDARSSSYERIMREVTTLSRLQHTNVVRYYQVSTSINFQTNSIHVMSPNNQP